ncbi:anthranilate synthase component I family protein [Microbacterium oleivorans]|uniref:Anthranilate synthase component I family protein n=1 Tax=Microbacterium oleivorans TaxID=273677 RepID=A0A7D5IUP4_9MICO|nr:anthranilate synthase component I family protein [Microbacterium oleivorans]QLD10462.1 anthranilate synthase component I family protein [Microbacterium oleivorans]
MPEKPARRRLEAWVDPAVVFGGIPDDAAFWLDAGPDAADGWSWLGTGVAAAVPDPFLDGAVRGTDPAGPFRGGWVGWFGYDAAARAAGAPARSDVDADDDALWLRVDRVVAFDHAARDVWLSAPEDEIDEFERTVAAWCEAGAARAAAPPASPAVLTATARVDPDAYGRLVEDCRAAIRRGDAYQLCLTTRFDVAADAALDPLAVFFRLRATAGSHHGGFIRSGARALVSASPERFLQLADGVVRTSPIKGTRPRGSDDRADARLIAELVSSPKERAENVMIVDLMRNDLQRVCDPGSVVVERLFAVESYPTVHQLVSTVAGRLRDGIRFSDLLAATFPAGSMTGAPKLSAMTILHGLERAPRGLFAGCFGWIDAGGRGDLAMVIRSIVIDGARAYVGAGGGITWGSEPDAEVAEVAVKARAPLDALGAGLPPRWRERVR